MGRFSTSVLLGYSPDERAKQSRCEASRAAADRMVYSTGSEFTTCDNDGERLDLGRLQARLQHGRRFDWRWSIGDRKLGLGSADLRCRRVRAALLGPSSRRPERRDSCPREVPGATKLPWFLSASASTVFRRALDRMWPESRLRLLHAALEVRQRSARQNITVQGMKELSLLRLRQPERQAASQFREFSTSVYGTTVSGTRLVRIFRSISCWQPQ